MGMTMSKEMFLNHLDVNASYHNNNKDSAAYAMYRYSTRCGSFKSTFALIMIITERIFQE